LKSTNNIILTLVFVNLLRQHSNDNGNGDRDCDIKIHHLYPASSSSFWTLFRQNPTFWLIFFIIEVHIKPLSVRSNSACMAFLGRDLIAPPKKGFLQAHCLENFSSFHRTLCLSGKPVPTAERQRLP